jgi:hypothetical protein
LGGFDPLDHDLLDVAQRLGVGLAASHASGPFGSFGDERLILGALINDHFVAQVHR